MKSFSKTPALPLLNPKNPKQTIPIGKVDFNKMVLIIYNPNSGKKFNSWPTIQLSLLKSRIEYEVHQTTGYLDGLNFVKDMDIGKYSAVIAVGGDGIIHEVINGMMRRKVR